MKYLTDTLETKKLQIQQLQIKLSFKFKSLKYFKTIFTKQNDRFIIKLT